MSATAILVQARLLRTKDSLSILLSSCASCGAIGLGQKPRKPKPHELQVAFHRPILLGSLSCGVQGAKTSGFDHELHIYGSLGWTFFLPARFSALRSDVCVDCCILASLQVCVATDCFHTGQSPGVRGGWVGKSKPGGGPKSKP